MLRAVLGACVVNMEVNAFLLYTMSVPYADYKESPEELLVDCITA